MEDRTLATTYSRKTTSGSDMTDTFAGMVRQLRVLGSVALGMADKMRDAQNETVRDLFKNLGLPMPSLSRAQTCRMPDCGCDDASGDLGTIRRELDRPEVATFSVTLRNRDCTARTYRIDGGPLSSGNPDNAPEIQVDPASVTLQPGERAQLRIAADASKFPFGTHATGQVTVRAEDCTPMYLTVGVAVVRPYDPIPTIDLHCDCKTGMRPQRWYHHYYCDPPKGRKVDAPPAPPAPVDQPIG
jgi:hypothetical protein